MKSTHKRFLFVTPPGYGHTFPMVPFASALLKLDQEVLVATCGQSLAIAKGAGLQSFNVSPSLNLPVFLEKYKHGFGSRSEESAMFSALGADMREGVARAAASFDPDVIIHTPFAAAAPCVAALMDIPSIFLGIGLEQTPRLMTEAIYIPTMRAIGMSAGTIPAPMAWIDVAPPGFRDTTEKRWPMAYVPYTGKGPRLSVEASRGSRLRIAVTLGTIIPMVRGLGSLGWVVAAASRVDADFVIAHGTLSQGDLGTLPENVRAFSWTPLDTLLSTCAAVIHHGGSGTTLTAFAAGSPQLILPQGADQFYNAEQAARSGAAILRTSEDSASESSAAADVELIRELVGRSSLRVAAETIREGIRGMPSPLEVADRLVETLS